MNQTLKQLFLVFALALLTNGCDRSSEATSDLQREIGTVSLKVDFGGDKPDKQIDVVCSADSTVLLSLQRAQNMNELAFQSSGSGETAFVQSIDGVDNETDGKSWIYHVNDELADKSAGIKTVKPGDVITWSYGTPPDELH